MRFIREKSFYRSIIAISVPIALQNLISFAVNMMDTVMLGMAPDGETLLSAASLGNQPFFILSMVSFGFASGSIVLAAQYWGKRDLDSIRTIMAMMLKLALSVSALITVFVIAAPESVMRIFSGNERIIAKGVEYLKILGWCYLFFTLSNCALIFLRSVEVLNIAVAANCVSLGLNVFLNWILIFGKLGFPALGIRGAAIATVAARIVEFCVTWGYILFRDKVLSFRVKDFLRFNPVLFRDMIRFGLPVLLNETLWGLGSSVQAGIFGHIDYTEADPVAANAVAQTIQQLVFVFMFGIANAAGVIIGKTIGEGKIKTARAQADTFRIFGYAIGLFGMLLLYFIRKPIVGFYNISEETRSLAEILIIVTAFITFFAATSGIGIVGLLRCGGDTRFCLFLEMGTLWLIAIPAAYAASRFLQLAVPYVLLAMKSDEIIKAVACVLRLRGSKWLHSTARDFAAERAAAQDGSVPQIEE